MVKRTTQQKRIEEERIMANEAIDEASDSDDAPEEESNASRRKSIKGLDKSRKGEQKRKPKGTKADNTAEKAGKKTEELEEVGQDEEESANISQMDTDYAQPESSSSSSSSSSTSHRLDPALFAASFSRSWNGGGGVKRLDGETKTTTEASKKKRRGAIAKGRDGQPMKRLKDGRTIIRVLPKSPPSATKGINMEEIYAEPASLDPTEILPTAKARAFRKQKLQLRDEQTAGTIQKQQKSNIATSVRTADDPLGLEDPAFMKRGEFATLGTSKKVAPKAAPSVFRGKRTRFSPAMSRRGQALHFARSS